MLAYLVFFIPPMLLGIWASWKTKSTFKRYSREYSSRGVTGAQAARIMLEKQGIYDVNIERVGGSLTDHYDPRDKSLRLSDDVYSSHSLAAIGVACHEAGHAIQHAESYAFLTMRSQMVPVVSIASNMSMWVLIAGFVLHFQPLILVACACFAVAFLFSVVTLPVEYDASARAKRAMVSAGLLSEQEVIPAGKVLNAAFLTYLAAAISSLMTLIYYLLRSGILGGDDD